MLPIFIILLLGALGSILISRRASHEIPRLLAVGSAIFCSILGFAVSPWPLQLVIFILILRLEWIYLYPFKRLGSVPLTISPRDGRGSR
jgi:energy-coupling factor transporter transmembrane protein EcfT